MPKRNSFLHIHPYTILFLKIGLAATCMQASLLYIAADDLYRTFKTYAYVHYFPALQYVVMSITLLIGGALMIEYVTKVYKETGGDG